MYKYLEKYNLPRLNQEKIENMNRQITWTETLIENLPTNKSPGPDGFKGNFYEKFREDLMPTQLKLLKKLQREENFQTWKWKSESEVAESCPTPSDPMDCSLPGSSVHGVFQARVLEWGAIAFSELKPKLCFFFFFFLFSSSTFSDCMFKSSLTTKKLLSTLSKMLIGNKILLLYSQKYTWASIPPLCSWKFPSFLLFFYPIFSPPLSPLPQSP